MSAAPERMAAVLLTGHGGFEKLEYRTDVRVPEPGPDEVLIEVRAASVNNTDVNTRIGWYGRAGDEVGGSWTGAPLAFPRIQGADCCGVVVAVGEGVSAGRLGERVIVRTMLRGYTGDDPYACWTFGSECDGGFAQYAKAPARDVYAMDCTWTDAELASIPCAYSTAENMLRRAGVAAETVVVTGASGGVGSAAVQLARRRGAEVWAVASQEKAPELRALGASRVVDRGEDPVEAFGAGVVDVVVDVVGGPQWLRLVETLRTGGRYAVAGAIAGAHVKLDLRTLYLRDLTFLGCTRQEDEVFETLVGYVERDEIRPVVAKTYPLSAIVEAQQDFLAKRFIGKLVLLPPGSAET
jgi:NADPH:quinone reductase-like Zn-dependent oxidoreductase